MISYLKGLIIDLGEEAATVDVENVGYEVHCTSLTRGELQLGEERVFWIHTHVREDALTLFGFLSKLEREFFLALNKVNGVGPKMALKIMSGGSVEHLTRMIENSDVKGLSGLPKVGKKTAEQIVLALKGKLKILADADTYGVSTHRSVAATSNSRNDIVSALVHLGFRIQDVERAVETFSSEMTVEEGIRKGLSMLTQV